MQTAHLLVTELAGDDAGVGVRVEHVRLQRAVVGELLRAHHAHKLAPVA